MTFDELKQLARYHGYRLQKLPKSTALKPCPKCGSKPTKRYGTGNLVKYVCKKCGASPDEYSEGRYAAHYRWNKWCEE